MIYLEKKCRRRDLNPRPFGIEPESTALDHSATSTLLLLIPLAEFYPRHTHLLDIFDGIQVRKEDNMYGWILLG